MNPKNGLCLNPFFHTAYDKNLLGISPDMEIFVSDNLLSLCTEDNFRNYLSTIDRTKISLPDKFIPNRDLLALHYDKYQKYEGK